MATLLITVPHVTSHILPALPIADALVKRGHRVLIHTAPRNEERVRATGAEFISMPEHCDIIYRLQNSSAKVPAWLPLFFRQLSYFRHEILAMVPDMMVELETLIHREQVDCLIADYLGFGASYTAEKLNIPFVSLTMSWPVTLNADAIPLFVASLPLPRRFIHALADTLFPLRRARQQVGLPPRPRNIPAEFFSVIVSNTLDLVTAHREFIPAKRLRNNQVFIGPTTFQMPRETDKQPYGASLEPGTVLVSYTTSYKEDEGLFRCLVESVAQSGVPVLAVSGSATNIPTDLGDNVRLETFVPFEEVLPYVRAMVTYGGFGTVGRAFKLGIPTLIITEFGDTMATGVRAEELGLAYHLTKYKVTTKAVKTKFNALLEDKALHTRLKKLSKQLLAMDPGEIATDAIENVLRNWQTSTESSEREGVLLR